MAQTYIKYGGATPGADGNTYVLFSTVDAGCPRNAFAHNDVRRWSMDLAHDQAGTLNSWKSQDGGVNWIQITTEAIVVPAAGTTTKKEILVEGLQDWKVEWVNGGQAQTVWALDMLLGDDRSGT